MRFRSPLLSQSRFLSFPPGTEMVHFPGFARARLWIHRAVWRLIAACHVLHRLLLPRHPPCALSSLTIKFARHIPETNPGRAAQILCRQSRSSHDCSSSFKFRVSSARRRSPRVIRNWKLETETGYVHQRDIGTHKNLHFAL
jgi:hypothetical protein